MLVGPPPARPGANTAPPPEMRAVGLFPLSIVLLPDERVPLHIFETRYKELINTCLATGDPFGMVLVAAEKTYDIGTLAHVDEVLERFEDGRLNIVVRGGDRFRLLGTRAERAYLTAEIDSYPDEEPAPDPEVVEAFRDRYRRVAEEMGLDLPGLPPGERRISFTVAARLSLRLDDKQELLGIRSESERLKKLSRLLPSAIFDARNRVVQQRAATNGHAKRIFER